MTFHARLSIHPTNCVDQQHAPLKVFWRGGQDLLTSTSTERYDTIPQVDFCPSFRTLTTKFNRDRRLMPDMCLSGHPQLLFEGLKDLLDDADRVLYDSPSRHSTEALRTLLWFLIDAEESATAGPQMASAEEIKIGSQEAYESFYLPAWLIDQILEAAAKAKRSARGPPPLQMPRLSSQFGGPGHQRSYYADFQETFLRSGYESAGGSQTSRCPTFATRSPFGPRSLSFASDASYWTDADRPLGDSCDALGSSQNGLDSRRSRRTLPRLDLAEPYTPTSEEVDRVMRFAESQLDHTGTSKAALLQIWARATSALGNGRPHVDESPKASRSSTPAQGKEDSYVDDFEYLGFEVHGSPSISVVNTVRSSAPDDGKHISEIGGETN